MRQRFNMALAGACLLGLMLSAVSAQAFRPSSRWLLDQVAARQLSRQSKPLKVVTEDMLFGRTGAPKGITAQGQVWIFPPDSIRRETEHADKRETLVRNATKEMMLDSAKGSGGVVKSKRRPHLIWDFLSMGKPLERKTAARQPRPSWWKSKSESCATTHSALTNLVSFLSSSDMLLTSSVVNPWSSKSK